MSSNKRSFLRNIFKANAACGCGKPKISDVFQPKPKTKISCDQIPILYPSSSSSWEKGGGDHSMDDDDDEEEEEEEDHTSTTFSLNIDASTRCSDSETNHPPYCSKMVSPCPKISDSVAVVKDSDDPYLDFRQSMVQMILEREIYSKDDLQELLSCFLRLNSPNHHEIIVQAFTEIWNGVISSSASTQDPSKAKPL